MSSLRGYVEFKFVVMGFINFFVGSELMMVMLMSNLWGFDDLGFGLGGVDVGRSYFVNKWGGEFLNFFVFFLLILWSNGGVVFESSFSIDYGDIFDVFFEFLVVLFLDLFFLG